MARQRQRGAGCSIFGNNTSSTTIPLSTLFETVVGKPIHRSGLRTVKGQGHRIVPGESKVTPIGSVILVTRGTGIPSRTALQSNSACSYKERPIPKCKKPTAPAEDSGGSLSSCDVSELRQLLEPIMQTAKRLKHYCDMKEHRKKSWRRQESKKGSKRQQQRRDGISNLEKSVICALCGSKLDGSPTTSDPRVETLHNGPAEPRKDSCRCSDSTMEIKTEKKGDKDGKDKGSGVISDGCSCDSLDHVDPRGAWKAMVQQHKDNADRSANGRLLTMLPRVLPPEAKDDPITCEILTDTENLKILDKNQPLCKIKPQGGCPTCTGCSRGQEQQKDVGTECNLSRKQQRLVHDGETTTDDIRKAPLKSCQSCCQSCHHHQQKKYEEESAITCSQPSEVN